MSGSNFFTIAYGCIFSAMLAFELAGVFYKFHDLDTMTANFRWLTERWPWIKIPVGIFLIWLFYHLLIQSAPTKE